VIGFRPAEEGEMYASWPEFHVRIAPDYFAEVSRPRLILEDAPAKDSFGPIAGMRGIQYYLDAKALEIERMEYGLDGLKVWLKRGDHAR
jgi:hypothetical protein